MLAPPSVGYYKLVIHAARVPRVKAKVIMPVVATFLVSCKITKHQYNIYRLSIVKCVCSVNGSVIISPILFRWNYWSFLRNVTSRPGAGASRPSAPHSRCHAPSRSSHPLRRLRWRTWTPAWSRGTRCSRKPRSLSTAAASWTQGGANQRSKQVISENVTSLFIQPQPC